MTAEMNESKRGLEFCTIEFEGKNGVVAGDSRGDLGKIDCNGNVSNGVDEIEEGKYEVDGSSVLVNGGTHDRADYVVSVEVEKDPRLEDEGDPTDFVETESIVEGENGLGVDDLIGDEKRIESGGFREAKEMKGVSGKENVEFEAVETVAVEVSVLSGEDCADGSRVELDGDVIQVKLVVAEENEAEVQYIEQVDMGIGLGSAEEEEMNQELKLVVNEAAELDSLSKENGKEVAAGIRLKSPEEERPNQEAQTLADELELLPVDGGDGGMEIQVEEKITKQEARTLENGAAELELLPVDNGDAGIQLESSEVERTYQETQMVPNESAASELATIENGDAEIQLESAEEERTQHETKSAVNEFVESKLLPIETGEDQGADQSNAGIQLEYGEEEMTLEFPTGVNEVAELELPPVENGKETELLNSPDEIQEEIGNEDLELQMKPGFHYGGETVAVNTCPIDDGDDDGPICKEVVGSEEIHGDGILPSATKDHNLSTSAAQLGVGDVALDATASDGQKVGDTEVGKKHYLIIIPRHIDNKIRSQIRLSQLEVDEKTRARDSLKAAVQMKRATRDEHQEKFEVAVSDERAAKAAADAKRQEMGPVQLMINRMNNAASIDDIDNRIHSMEHMIAHETMPLKEEKRLIREIKQLKVAREQLYASMGKDTELQEVFDKRENIEESFKVLKQEFETLRNEVFKAEGVTKAHKTKRSDALESFKEVYGEWLAADKLRQEAYTKLQNLRKQSYEKNKFFYQYKEDQEKARMYSSARDREALQCHCSKQVERVMELWNKNDEFRKEYMKDNLRSTLWRFKTLDGRSLGPDERPAVLTNFVDEETDIAPLKPSKKNVVVPVSAIEILQEKADSAVAKENMFVRPPIAETTSQKSSSATPNKLNKPAIAATSIAIVSGRKEEEGEERENERTKEVEELVRKAELLRKEEAAAKLKEQCRLEQIAKAKEAEERKKRNAEKANTRAELRAQQEAERREKAREKRARKKERRKAAAAEATSSGIEEETAPTSDNKTPAIILELETQEKTAASMPRKRSAKVVKQAKPKPLVMPPRQRTKKKMQTWLWILLLAVVIVALLLLSNGFTNNLRLLSFRL